MKRDRNASQGRLGGLILAALGVVFGDIGTSPLYAMKEVFAGSHHPVPLTPDNILGILSLLFWSLVVVVSIKYVVFIMRADNHGEGGVMALMALVMRSARSDKTRNRFMLLGLFGAALFYGDGVITPAISVLSAVEGLEVAAPGLSHLVVPITLGILIALFSVQRHGTARVGKAFGIITSCWFLTLAVLGVVNLLQAPHVLAALSPTYAVAFFAAAPKVALLSLGGVVLVLTGAEALYADMGHFGARPIRYAWFGFVLPSLVLNYFGQGALLLTDPSAIDNPFYRLVPSWGVFPMVLLATGATVIASQAVISGAFSVTQQAMQLGYVPNVEVQHTSHEEKGQVFLPGVNWALLAAVCVLVLTFRSSNNLAAAYGIAVTGTMLIDTLLAFIVVQNLWGWSRWRGAAVAAVFLTIDMSFLFGNLVKLEDGGWFPLALGIFSFTLMTTWKRGRQLLHQRLSAEAIPLEGFIEAVGVGGIPSVPGTAIFMTPHPENTPHALLHSLKHYKSLHQHIVILTVVARDVPHVEAADRMEIQRLNPQFTRVKLRFGFMDQPDVMEALQGEAAAQLGLEPMTTSFFLGRETLIPERSPELPLWRKLLFRTMFRNSGSPAAYFRLPPNRVVELGAQIVF